MIVLPSSKTDSNPIPALPGRGLKGNVPDLILDTLGFYEKAWRTLGDVARIQAWNSAWYLISHPDDIERILRGSTKEFRKGMAWDVFRLIGGRGLISVESADHWLQHRRMLQPAFLRLYHETFADRISEAMQNALPHFHQLARKGEAFDVTEEMTHLTLQNAFLTLFGGHGLEEANVVTPQLTVMLDYLNSQLEDGAYTRFKNSILKFFPSTRYGRFYQARRQLHQLLESLVEQRQRLHEEYKARQEAPPGDLIQCLLYDEEGKPRQHDRDFLREQLSTFVFTGHETTGLCITWTLFFLAQHPEIQTRLQQELDAVLDGRAPVFADLPQLPYLDRVLDESLRLRPPVWSIPRQTTQAEEFQGYRLPENAVILVLPYLTHRHPDFWSNPETFDPERFTPENAAGRHPFCYIPFGGGPRQCIGKRTAKIEAQLIVANLLQRFSFSSQPDASIFLTPTLTLRSQHGIPLKIHARNI